jgi:chromosome segregation ATPase
MGADIQEDIKILEENIRKITRNIQLFEQAILDKFEEQKAVRQLVEEALAGNNEYDVDALQAKLEQLHHDVDLFEKHIAAEVESQNDKRQMVATLRKQLSQYS